jgi:UDP-N-acetylmuramyl pentapeptide phosphotransferase/UDP-N-acetylglucosamine-1-phosphate transferase
MITSQLVQYLGAAIAAAVLSYLIIWAVRPLLLRHALAKPNARSSHRVPTPQGAGIAVIAATISVSAAIGAWSGNADARTLTIVFGATLFIAAVGFADDLRSIAVMPRLLLQALAVAVVVFMLPDSMRIAQNCPLWIERSLVLFAGLWFVNLVNFMDGLDLMTVAETVPVTAALTLLGWMGEIPSSTTIVAAALCGAMVGFAPFNRPIAKIFLGDVGSLPIGLLLGWCLLQLAWHQQWVAAALLPLYYLADATITLLRRMARAEPFWAAHRSHFYQRATDNGFTTLEVVSLVFVLNVALGILAIVSTMSDAPSIKLLLLLAGCVAVASLIYRFARHRQ